MLKSCTKKNITRSALYSKIVRILAVSYTHQKCASGRVMPIPHPLMFLMVLIKVEFCHQFVQYLYGWLS